jgi:2-polyprenyl-3-methyl-5-hydroxy-6-metoxy-1,4-benzoquinol methylase
MCSSQDTINISTYTADNYNFYYCNKCEGIFANPMKSAGKEWYESSDLYQEPQTVSDYLQWPEKLLLKDIGLSKDLNILNIGCGKTIFLKKLKESGCMVTGVDINEKMIRFTKNILGIENVHVSEISDFIDNYQGKKFDIIVFFEVLEHLENPAEFVNNLKNILSGSGIIVFSVPNRERFLPSKHIVDYPPHHLTRWNSKSIKSFLEYNDYIADKIMISPFTAEVILQLFGIFFGTKHLEKKIEKGDNRILIKTSYKILFKFRVIFYNVLAIILRVLLKTKIKTKGVDIYAVARIKNK